MLNKEPEMLQSDAFCEHTIMQQSATAALGGSLQRSPPQASFKGVASPQGEGGEGRKGEGR